MFSRRVFVSSVNSYGLVVPKLKVGLLGMPDSLANCTEKK